MLQYDICRCDLAPDLTADAGSAELILRRDELVLPAYVDPVCRQETIDNRPLHTLSAWRHVNFMYATC